MALIVEQWSTDASANSSPPPNGAPEGMFADLVNDTMRQMMASQREIYDGVIGLIANMPGGADLETPTALAETAWQDLDSLVIQPGSTADFDAGDLTIEGEEVFPGLPRNYLDGFTTSKTGPTNLSFGAGYCVDALSTFRITNLTPMIKDIGNAWAAGSNNGGLFSGSLAATTWYHCFVIKNSTSGAVDFGFSTDINASDRPAGYNLYRRVWSIITDVSSEIEDYLQVGDHGTWINSRFDYNQSNPGPSPINVTLTTPPDVRTLAHLSIYLQLMTPAFLSVVPGDKTAVANSSEFIMRLDVPGGSSRQGNLFYQVLTDTSSRIQFDLSTSDIDTLLQMQTMAWTDSRGKDS